MLFVITSVCSPLLCCPCGGNQSDGIGEHGQSNIQKKPTKICSLPPPRYVHLHYAIHVVGTKVDNALANCIMCAVLMEINLGRCT